VRKPAPAQAHQPDPVWRARYRNRYQFKLFRQVHVFGGHDGCWGAPSQNDGASQHEYGFWAILLTLLPLMILVMDGSRGTARSCFCRGGERTRNTGFKHGVPCGARYGLKVPLVCDGSAIEPNQFSEVRPSAKGHAPRPLYLQKLGRTRTHLKGRVEALTHLEVPEDLRKVRALFGRRAFGARYGKVRTFCPEPVGFGWFERLAKKWCLVECFESLRLV